MDALFHETLYRGEEVLARLRECNLVVCGAGALGANIAESLVRSGATRIAVIDQDRIEERNLSTQPFHRSDVGSFKASILCAALFRIMGVKAVAHRTRLDASNADGLLRDAHLIIDAFDNSVSRRVVWEYGQRSGCPVLHAGMAPEYAEVIWNEDYRVPSDAMDDVCDYPLARNLVMLTVAICCEVAIRWVASGAHENRVLTLRDLRISSYPNG